MQYTLVKKVEQQIGTAKPWWRFTLSECLVVMLIVSCRASFIKGFANKGWHLVQSGWRKQAVKTRKKILVVCGNRHEVENL